MKQSLMSSLLISKSAGAHGELLLTFPYDVDEKTKCSNLAANLLNLARFMYLFAVRPW